MKYLTRFNQKLGKLRADKKLESSDIAEICRVDITVAEAWEADDDKRCYPSLENVLDLCFKTGRPLDHFIDMPESSSSAQLELPGLTFIEDSDLDQSLTELNKELNKLIPTEDEQELLKRYRKSDLQSRELILQLIAN